MIYDVLYSIFFLSTKEGNEKENYNNAFKLCIDMEKLQHKTLIHMQGKSVGINYNL